MDDHEIQSLLRSEGQSLTPGPMPDLIGMGRAARRRRIGGVSAAAAILVGAASVVSAQALSNDTGRSVSVADSPTTSDEPSAPTQLCPSGKTLTTTLEPGWVESEGYKSLTALAMSLEDSELLGIRGISTVEVLEQTNKDARLLLVFGEDNDDQAVVHAELTDAAWTATLIEQCQ